MDSWVLLRLAGETTYPPKSSVSPERASPQPQKPRSALVRPLGRDYPTAAGTASSIVTIAGAQVLVTALSGPAPEAGLSWPAGPGPSRRVDAPPPARFNGPES